MPWNNCLYYTKPAIKLLGPRIPFSLKIMEDPKSFCLCGFSIITMLEIKTEKIFKYVFTHLGKNQKKS